MKGFKDSDGKFRPISNTKGIRKKSDKTRETTGIKMSTGIRKKHDTHSDLKGFESLNLVTDDEVRHNMENILLELRNKFIINGMENGMIWSFLEDCVNGQIKISLLKDDKEHYTNTLGDFYIDSRVGFKGVKDVSNLVHKQMRDEIKKIVIYDNARFVVGDIVKPEPATSNVALRDAVKEKPEITFKIMEMDRGLDPHYIGYEIVDVDRKPFKKNWIYAGNDNLVQGEVL